MKGYGDYKSTVIDCDGAVLTLEILEAGHKNMLESFGKPEAPIPIPPTLFQDLVEWEKREKYWRSLGPIGYKMEALRWRLKHRAKHTVMNLPE